MPAQRSPPKLTAGYPGRLSPEHARAGRYHHIGFSGLGHGRGRGGAGLYRRVAAVVRTRSDHVSARLPRRRRRQSLWHGGDVLAQPGCLRGGSLRHCGPASRVLVILSSAVATLLKQAAKAHVCSPQRGGNSPWLCRRLTLLRDSSRTRAGQSLRTRSPDRVAPVRPLPCLASRVAFRLPRDLSRPPASRRGDVGSRGQARGLR